MQDTTPVRLLILFVPLVTSVATREARFFSPPFILNPPQPFPNFYAPQPPPSPYQRFLEFLNFQKRFHSFQEPKFHHPHWGPLGLNSVDLFPQGNEYFLNHQPNIYEIMESESIPYHLKHLTPPPEVPYVETYYPLYSPPIEPLENPPVFKLILGGKFPPRIEQVVQRIQNYFSTYTQIEGQRPDYNPNKTTTTEASTVEVNSASSQGQKLGETTELDITTAFTTTEVGTTEETITEETITEETITEETITEETITEETITEETTNEIPNTTVINK